MAIDMCKSKILELMKRKDEVVCTQEEKENGKGRGLGESKRSSEVSRRMKGRRRNEFRVM